MTSEELIYYVLIATFFAILVRDGILHLENTSIIALRGGFVHI